MAHAQGHTNQAAPREPVGAAQADKGDKEEEEEEEALRVIAHEIEQHSGLQCECYQGWRQRISFAMRGRLDYYRVYLSRDLPSSSCSRPCCVHIFVACVPVCVSFKRF
eukprot:TRINITY_DN7181_c0_g1_i1.p1 TRINITY_DN7181_c0_g1~~TRINITY_DN7181_c0_g1_i1.p1  ORF type:complete len:108 (+),score=18.97 TRINITY_DN7181_c0_g1_i1:166-489(+)